MTVINQASSFQKNIIKKGFHAEDCDISLILQVHQFHETLVKAIAIHCQHSSFSQIGRGVLAKVLLPYNGNSFPLGKESKPFIDRYEDYKRAAESVK